MEWVSDFIFQNFILLFISIVMVIHTIYTFKKHPKISLFSLLIIICTLVLAVSHTLENYAKSIVDPDMTLIFAIVGYTLRPTCVYLFILLTIDTKKNKWIYLAAIPLLINLIIYSLSFFEPLKEYVVYFEINDEGTLSFGGGILHYSSHVISLLYMVWLAYISFSTFRFKKLSRALITLICTLAVISAAVVESFFNSDNNIYILNTVISLCTLAYYLFLVVEYTELDTITDLYNKEKYYKDIDLYDKNISGVALFKIVLSPNNSQEKNEKILEESASLLIKCINRNMIVYHYENDQFLLLTKGDKEELKRIVDKYGVKMHELNYRFIFNQAFKEKHNEPIHILVSTIEKNINSRTNLTYY